MLKNLDLFEKSETKRLGNFDGLEANIRRIEWYADRKLFLRVNDQILLHITRLELSQLLECVGDLVDERPIEFLLVRLDRRVEEENTLDLSNRELGTHVAYALDVRLGLASLEKLTCLDYGLEGLDRARFLEFRVAEPLLQMGRVVAQFDAFRPVTHLFAQD